MSRTVTGFPFWEAAFDQEGKPKDPTALTQAVQEIKTANLTDLFVFSHGWNNDRTTAQVLYDGFFGELRKLIDDTNLSKKRAAQCGVIGVFWPSILWPDEQASSAEASAGGAASLGQAATKQSELPPLDDLIRVFGADHADTLQRMHQLLKTREGGKDGLREFSQNLASLLKAQDRKTGTEDSLEIDALGDKQDAWQNAFELLSEEEATESSGGAADLGDQIGRLWDGAKGALRIATYWQMKNRAGIVGRSGLGPFIKQISIAKPDLQIHLLGHSFGARLVSYALDGLGIPAETSPVKSLFLLQGAFSHFTFAGVLPFDQTRSGDLKGKDRLVDGPLLTTFSEFDTAVGRSYPLASIVAGQDNAAIQKVVSRWGGMGSDGAQAVSAHQLALARAGAKYDLKRHQWYNLDSNNIIKNGGPPSGAHSDIIHPETAWAALSAAGIA